MKEKNIEFIAGPQERHWVGDGFYVHNFIPYVHGLSMRDMDPFILLDYNPRMEFAPSTRRRGVGVHPHRGFETVTIAYHGKVAHHDSAGNSGVIGTGDVQWMTAASGVLHKEYHESEFNRRGGDFQMVQLWVNLPAKDKMSKPKYQAIPVDKMGQYILPDDGGMVEVIAGEFKGVKGPAYTFTPVALMNTRLNKDGVADFSFPADFNTALLVVEGSVYVNGEKVERDHIVKFGHSGETFTVKCAVDNAVALIMSGKPLNEPIAAHGPFVMNHESEIYQAMHDLESGKFGYLDD